MLDAYIIEQIKREEALREDRPRLTLEIPVDFPRRWPERNEEPVEEGPIVIPLVDPVTREDAA